MPLNRKAHLNTVAIFYCHIEIYRYQLISYQNTLYMIYIRRRCMVLISVATSYNSKNACLRKGRCGLWKQVYIIRTLPIGCSSFLFHSLVLFLLYTSFLLDASMYYFVRIIYPSYFISHRHLS